MINSQAKQGYKHTPLGWIPEEWKLSKLEALVEIKSGESPTVFNLKREGKYPYIKVEDLNNCEKYQSKSRQYSDDNKGLVPPESIIFPKRGAAILNNKVRINSVSVQMDSNLMSIQPNTLLVEPEFLYYKILHTELFRIADTSTIPQINNKHILPYIISLPPLPEQKAIAKVLSTWDEAISKTQELITQKELRKKWLMQQLLTGKKRLKGFKGEWKKVQLGEIFERVTRKNNGVSTNVVTISAQRGFVRQGDFFNKIVASETLDNYYLIKKGEFCYNKSYSNGYNWGATKRLNDFDEAVVTTLYICFRLKNVIENSGNFFEFYFDANLLDEGLTQIAHEGGRAHGLLNVTPIDFFNLIIRIPSFEEQQIIAEIIKSSYEELRLFNKYLELLKNQKQGLMQVLLSGKKRI